LPDQHPPQSLYEFMICGHRPPPSVTDSGSRTL
jgi:hypothetical protein